LFLNGLSSKYSKINTSSPSLTNPSPVDEKGSIANALSISENFVLSPFLTLGIDG
jgi:hypothetical protein